MKEAGDVKRAQATVAAMQQRMQQLDADFRAESGATVARIDAGTEQLETMNVRAARTGITFQLFALGWLPYWKTG